MSRSFPGAESPGTNLTLSPGSYSVSETGSAGYIQSLSGNCSGTINAGDNKVCIITNNDKPQTAGPSITVRNVHCGGTDFLGQHNLVFDISFQGIFHDSHFSSFTLQYYIPNGNLLRTATFTIQDNAPDPYNAGSTISLPVPPGPTAGTYKIVMVVFYDYNNAVSTTFQAPECFQQ